MLSPDCGGDTAGQVYRSIENGERHLTYLFSHTEVPNRLVVMYAGLIK